MCETSPSRSRRKASVLLLLNTTYSFALAGVSPQS
jgi:hypothetical protein